MKQRYISFILFAIFFVNSSLVAQTLKIGYVDADSILRAFSDAKKKQEELKAYGEQLQKALEEKQKTFEEKYKAYNTTAASLPALVRADKEKELQQLSTNIQEFEQQAQADLSQKEQQTMQPVLEKIKESINNVAKENGYNYVLPKALVLYGDKKHDLTNLVIKKLGGT